MEALGDAIVFRPAPHHGDFRPPAEEGTPQLAERLQWCLLQLIDEVKKFFQCGPGLLLLELFEQEQLGQFLFKVVDGLQSGMLLKIASQVDLLLLFELFGMSSHEAEQSAIFSSCWIQELPGSKEVVIDQSNHVKAIRDDMRSGEVGPGDGSVGCGEVHADYANTVAVGNSL